MKIYFLTILFAFYSTGLCIPGAALFPEKAFRSLLLTGHRFFFSSISKAQTKEEREKSCQAGIEFINNFPEQEDLAPYVTKETEARYKEKLIQELLEEKERCNNYPRIILAIGRLLGIFPFYIRK